jgi:hypothetical protein
MTGTASLYPPSDAGAILGITLDFTSICGRAGHAVGTAYRDRVPVELENPAGWPSFVLVPFQNTRYTSPSKPAGPLPQGMHTSAGVSLRGGRS